MSDQCKHHTRFIEWEDHSKPISCVKCRLAAVDRQRPCSPGGEAMNITERLIAWNMNMNDGRQTNQLLCDAVKEIATLTARLAAAEARESALRGLLREACDSWDQVEHAGTMRYADGCFARLTNDWRVRVTAALEGKQ